MALFRVMFTIALLVEARDEQDAIAEGRSVLQTQHRERSFAEATLERITSASALAEREIAIYPWGGRSARTCGEIAGADERPATHPGLRACPEQGDLFGKVGA